MAVRFVAWCLAAALGFAAVAKLTDRAGTRRSFEELDLRSAAALSVIVPFGELLAAVGLVVAPAAGAAFALLLMIAFTVVVVRVVRSGAAVACACFGALSRRRSRLGWGSVVRNVAMAVGALWVFLDPPSPPLWRG